MWICISVKSFENLLDTNETRIIFTNIRGEGRIFCGEYGNFCMNVKVCTPAGLVILSTPDIVFLNYISTIWSTS